MFKGSAAKLALRRIDELFHSGIAGDLSDSELIDRFLRCGDSGREFAFAALVERHGAMVFRVCRQALKDHHDAQDAVQATFLVLARRAGAIRKRTSVSSWLFGVARRAAGHIRMQEARRRRFELRAAQRAIPAIEAALAPLEPDPYPELHAEIERLPEKYRLPIVLCYLEGLTHEQAASRLRWPLGTVKIRLTRARVRLRVRLEKRGRPYLLVMPVSSLRPGLPEHLVNSITQAGCGTANKGAAGGVGFVGGRRADTGGLEIHGVREAKSGSPRAVWSLCAWVRQFRRGTAGDGEGCVRPATRRGHGWAERLAWGAAGRRQNRFQPGCDRQDSPSV